MKTRNILFAFFTCAFLLGVSTINAQDKIYVHEKNGTAVAYDIADLDSISFTPPAAPIDYTKLKINEVSGVGGDADKFYELINTGTEDIPLAGCKIYYNANGLNGGTLPSGDGSLTWTGLSTQIAQAGKLFSLIGRNNPGSFTTGLTATRILIITLKDPAGNVIDQCIRAEDTGDYAFTDQSFSRIPDGSGPFYFTTPSPDVMNGNDATGLTEVPETQAPPVFVSSNLVINEIDGNGKFVEIYNKGTATESLEGFTLVKNEKDNWWTGGTGLTLAAGGFYTVCLGPGTGCENEATGLNGISSQQNLKFQLKKSDGTIIDEFLRSNGGALGATVTPNYSAKGAIFSFSRCPNGTGNFQLAVPSCNATNNASEGDIVTNP